MEKSADAFRTITEVAELLETPAHVLRFWESRFPQIKPVKRAGGRRYYRPSDVALLTGIKRLLHDEGMTIRGVQRILREQGVRHVAGLTDDPSPEEEALEAAMLARLDMEEVHPRTTLEIAVEQARALEAALDTSVAAVVLPFRQPEPAQPDVPLEPVAASTILDHDPAADDEIYGAHDPDMVQEPAIEERSEAATEYVFVVVEPALEVEDAPAPGPEDVTPPDDAPDPEPVFEPAPETVPETAPETAPEAPPKGPGLKLTSVTGATRTADLPVESPAPPDAAEQIPVPLANRLRALPPTALARHQAPARASLARLTALRNRLANPTSPPRT